MSINRWLALFIVIFISSSCVNKVDLDNVNNFSYRGEWAVPLVQASLKLEDLVAEDTTFTQDPDGGIRIIFIDDSIANTTAKELIEVPDQEPQYFNMVSGAPVIESEVEIGALEEVELKHITISEGILNWSAYNPISNPVQIELAILNADVNGDTAKFIIDANTMGETSGSIDISGLHFDFTQGSLGYNNISYRMGIIDDGGAPAGTSYDITIELKDFELREAIGYFGNRKIELPSSTIQTQISGFESLLSGLRIENPTIELNISGNLGLPLQLVPDFDGVNRSGSSTPLLLPDIIYEGPAELGNWSNSTIVIDKDNSNVVDFIASVPSEIVVAGDVIMNPNGKSGHDNFVSLDAEMNVGLKLDIPLEIRTNNLILEHEIVDLNWGVNEQDVEFVEELNLFLKVTNGFPFDANLKLVFYDKITGESTDSLDVDFLTSAIVDNSGKVSVPSISRPVIEFQKENISNLLNSNKVQLLVTLNSYNEGQDIVKLYVTDFIDIAIGVQTKLNYNL